MLLFYLRLNLIFAPPVHNARRKLLQSSSMVQRKILPYAEASNFKLKIMQQHGMCMIIIGYNLKDV
jgi:hypothetical protein